MRPPRKIRTGAVALMTLGLVAAAARAGIDIEVGNGDVVTGTLSPATEVETFRVRVPAGAKLSVKAKSAKKGPSLHVTLVDPAAAQAGSADGKAPSIGVLTASSGVFTVTVASQDGTSVGDYSLGISWKSATSFPKTIDLASGASATLEFAADAGAVATISARPAKRSPAAAALEQLTAPDNSVTALTGTSTRPVLALAGGYVLRFGNSGATTGGVTATVKLKPPKPAKRKVALTSKVIGSGSVQGDAAVAALFGSVGGTLTVPLIGAGQPGAAISGSSVAIPAGSLPSGTAIYIATAPDVAQPGVLVDAGPTVFFGPEGTRFDKNDKAARATVSIPYDAAFDGSTGTIVIYTRDAKGKVTAVPQPYTFNALTHTVSFAASHFSSFQAAGTVSAPSFTLNTLADLLQPFDVCLAFDPASVGQRIQYYVAGGSDNTVIALRTGVQPGPLVVPEVYAGGGAIQTPGVPRLQFQFPLSVVAVYATNDGHLWAATPNQIFEVDAAGNVQRVAGTGQFGDAGDGGSALSATFNDITDILVTSSRQIYVMEQGSRRIRFIDPANSNRVSAWAGTASAGVFGQDNIDILTTTFLQPKHMAFDSAGTGLYVTDGGRVRYLRPGGTGVGVNLTLAGGDADERGNTGDGGPLLTARFMCLTGITFYADPFNPTDHVLIVADEQDHTLRKLNLTKNTVTLAAGQHGQHGFGGNLDVSTGLLDRPYALLSAANDIVFVDFTNHRIRVQTLLQ